jgi:hypothetical protein
MAVLYLISECAWVFCGGKKMVTFTSALKTFGADVERGVKALMGSPTVIIQDAANIPQDITDVKQFFAIVKTVEGMFAASKVQPTAAQKLAAAHPYVSTLLQEVEAFDNNKIGSMIKDQVAFNAGVDSLINAIVQLSNSLGS